MVVFLPSRTLKHSSWRRNQLLSMRWKTGAIKNRHFCPCVFQ